VTKISATLQPGFQPPPPPREPGIVTIVVPEPVAEAIMTFMNYSPTVEAFHQIMELDKPLYAWEGTPAYELFEALRRAGVKSKYSERRPGGHGAGFGYGILSKINVHEAS
jgi:hypothetical protein